MKEERERLTFGAGKTSQEKAESEQVFVFNREECECLQTTDLQDVSLSPSLRRGTGIGEELDFQKEQHLIYFYVIRVHSERDGSSLCRSQGNREDSSSLLLVQRLSFSLLITRHKKQIRLHITDTDTQSTIGLCVVSIED